MNIRKALSFDDVLIVPQRSVVSSRDEVILTTPLFEGVKLSLPIIAANMPSVCNAEMAAAMATNGGLGVIHRMQSEEDQADAVRRAVEIAYDTPFGATKEPLHFGAAIGIDDRCMLRAAKCRDAGADILCLDVAHAHSERAGDVLLSLLRLTDAFIIVGNIATAAAADFFINGLSKEQKGRVVLKVGIGGGSVCTTRIKTGCGVPTFQSVLDVSRGGYRRVIADGGIRNSGDIVKCLAAGASAVMVGSLLAGTDEAPGEIVNGKKLYYGSASETAKQQYYGKSDYIEGTQTMVWRKGPVKDVLESLADGIRSGVSYAGTRSSYNLALLNPEFIEITQAGMIESSPHGVKV